MNNIINSIKLDYYILKSTDFRRILVVAAVAVLVSYMSKNPPLALGIIMMMSGFFMSTIFAVVEKNNLNKLYGILPVKKQQTVIGRYTFTFLVGLALTVAATILALAISLFLNVGFGGFTLAFWICGSFLVFCLLVSLQFPLYFKYDFSKLAAIANLPYIVLIILGSYLAKKNPQFIGQAAAFFIHNPFMIWVITILGALILLFISLLVSDAFYKKREL